MAESRASQAWSFSFTDSLLAEIADVPQALLHYDVDAICRAYDAIVPVADRLGVPQPTPRLAGFAYTHVSTLGAKVLITPDSPEPYVYPCIESLEDIDRLKEPEDYLAAGVIPERLETLRKLKQRRPDAMNFIGHDYEGPITTAVLMMGDRFLMLPYDDPRRAHRLLEFCVHSALNYCRSVREYLGLPVNPGEVWVPDDFAGMFPPEIFAEFVVPYLEKMYSGQQATRRALHSELIRPEHLPFLEELKIDVFDPGTDQYLTPEILRDQCPVPYQLRIKPSEVVSMSADELVQLYQRLASCNPIVIQFSLDRLSDEPKIAALLEIARQME